MQRAKFLEYIAHYNAGDVDSVLGFFDEKIIFENFGRHQQGAAVGEFLRGLHHVVTDRMEPRTIVIEGDNIALEADSEITAHIDLPELPVGAMRKGETATMRMFAFYQTKGDRILHVRVSGWPLVQTS